MKRFYHNDKEKKEGDNHISIPLRGMVGNLVENV